MIWTILKAWLIGAWTLPILILLHMGVRAGLRWIREIGIPTHRRTDHQYPRCTCPPRVRYRATPEMDSAAKIQQQLEERTKSAVCAGLPPNNVTPSLKN